MTLNFHSSEFNRIDDLNDCSGNSRVFQPLDGVVTADMRHQMDRRSGGETIGEAASDAVPVKSIEPEEAVKTTDVAPPLTVVSRGRTLIVDTEAERGIVCAKRLSEQELTCTLLVTNKKAAADTLPSQSDQFRFLEVDTVSITGSFGGFSATVTANGEQQHLAERLGDEASIFDLVLDLQTIPSYAGYGLPMGYYAPGTYSVTLDEAMEELPEMRGRFHRPQFTIFLKDRCIRGRSRTHDCNRCIAVCPFGAIRSADQNISIDHHRCQGCGGCAMVCPADAIQKINPSQEELLNLLRRTLEKRSAGAASPPTLVISDLETAGGQKPSGTDEGNHDNPVYFAVEQIGHVGLETLLAALAYGAGAVVVACGAQNPADIRMVAQGQVEMGRAILRGLDLTEENIRFSVITPEDNGPEETASAGTCPGAQPDKPPFPPAIFSPDHDKRTLIRLATQHLYDHSGARQPSIPLPEEAPFGRVEVDAAACTLCMACAVACPSGALFAKGDLPRLEFIESRCHQCRLCEEVCPEGAIRLQPRILCDPKAVETPTALNETEPVRCIECGAPFASQAMISRIQDRLAGHWMYAADRQLRRLRMCCTCRTRDALGSQDMKSWNQR